MISSPVFVVFEKPLFCCLLQSGVPFLEVFIQAFLGA